MNRDPKSQSTLAQAVRKWMNDANDEADIEFERALIEQGVMNPDEAVIQFIGGNGSVFVTIECEESLLDGEDIQIIRIDVDGRVTEEQ